MSAKNKNTVNPVMTLIVTLAVILLIVMGIIAFIPFSASSTDSVQVQEGVSYLKELENKEVFDIDEELRKQAEADTEGMSVWEKLDYYDTYIIGDSRVEVLYWSGIQQEHVFVEKSSTIRYLKERMEDIINARPGNLVISFGINDLGVYLYDPENYWETGQEYVEELDIYIQEIKERSPDTNIYVNSIIPVLDHALEAQPRWALIDEWNEVLKEYCESHDVVYIDANYITDFYGDYFDDDGVHFYAQEAINDWGTTILEAVEEQSLR